MSAVTGESPAGRVRGAELAIGGMTCASCAARIEKKLSKLDGGSGSRAADAQATPAPSLGGWLSGVWRAARWSAR